MQDKTSSDGPDWAVAMEKVLEGSIILCTNQVIALALNTGNYYRDIKGYISNTRETLGDALKTSNEAIKGYVSNTRETLGDALKTNTEAIKILDGNTQEQTSRFVALFDVQQRDIKEILDVMSSVHRDAVELDSRVWDISIKLDTIERKVQTVLDKLER